MSKSYHHFCGVARALDRLGERWTLLILRDLLVGPMRYGDLLHSLAGITTNLLAKRLAELTVNGLIEHVALPAPAAAMVYRITDLGRSAEPAILALGYFGSQFMDRPHPNDRLNPRWAMLSLKRRFNGAESSGVVGLEFAGIRFQARFTPTTIDVQQGESWWPVEAGIAGTMADFRNLFSEKRSLEEAMQSPTFALHGERKQMLAFLRAVGCGR